MEEDFRLYVFKLTKTHSIFLDCFLHKIMSNHHLRQLITSEKTWKQSKCFRGKSNPVLRPNARIIFIFTYLQPVTNTCTFIRTCLFIHAYIREFTAAAPFLTAQSEDEKRRRRAAGKYVILWHVAVMFEQTIARCMTKTQKGIGLLGNTDLHS